MTDNRIGSTISSRDANRDTAPIPLTAIRRTYGIPPPHQHPGAPPPPSFPTERLRADGGSMLPVPLLAASLPPPLLASLYDTGLDHHRQRQQQPPCQKFVIEHHSLPDEGIDIPLSSPASAPMLLEPCVSGRMSENLTTTESMDDYWDEKQEQEQAKATYIGNIESMTCWENQPEEVNAVCNENTGDGAADDESTDTLGTVDLGTLSDDTVPPVIQLPWQDVQRRRSRAIKATSMEDRTHEENERRNVKNNRGRANTRDKKIKLQEILAKSSSDQPEDQTQEEMMFVQAYEQARIIKNRRNRARLKERKNKLQVLLAKPPDQRSAVEQAFLEQQTVAMKRKNKNDRLRQARYKLLASKTELEPEQQRSNLKIAPRGASPYDVCSFPSSQLPSTPQAVAGADSSKLQDHNEHRGSYNGLIHKDATGNVDSECADGDNDINITTLDVLVAVSATLPLVTVSATLPHDHVHPAVDQSQKVVRRSRARARNAARRRRVVEIKAIQPEDRTPGNDAFLQAVGQQRRDKNDRSRMRVQETKHKLQTILDKSSDQRSEIEQAFVEQQAAAKQRKNRGDYLRRRSLQLQL
jgi:Holliday junction resolvasome RuvABC endonuclease subunit